MDYHPTVIGIDPSLEALGFASIQPPDEFALGDSEGYGKTRFATVTLGGKGKRSATMRDRSARIKKLAWQVKCQIQALDFVPDLAVMEDFPHGTAGGSVFDRIGLYWKCYEVCEDLGIPVAMVNVAKVKQFATGIGSGPNAGKAQVTLAIARRYPDAPIQDDNQADAFAMAAMGLQGLGHILAPIPLGHMVAFEATKSQPSFADQLREIGVLK